MASTFKAGSAGSEAFGSNVTTFEVDGPTGVALDDTVVLAFQHSAAARVFTPAAGFTERAHVTESATDGEVVVWTGRGADVGAGPYTFTVNTATNGMWGWIVVEGVDPAATLDVAVVAQDQAAALEHALSITPVTDGSLVVGVIGCDPSVTGLSTSWAGPAIERLDVTTSSLNHLSMATHEQPLAGAQVISATYSASEAAGIVLLALRAAEVVEEIPAPVGYARPRARVGSSQLTVRLREVGGTWVKIGTGHKLGVVPESFTCSANEGGPDTCSFQLRRDPKIAWPDLAAFTHAEVEVGGVVVWGGRLWETPGQSGQENTLSVQGRGWQYHLDDDLMRIWFIRSHLRDWSDQRELLGANLSVHTRGGRVSSGDRAIEIGWAKGDTVVFSTAVGVTIDMGPWRKVQRISFTFDRGVVAPTDVLIYIRGHDSEDPYTLLYNDANVILMSNIVQFGFSAHGPLPSPGRRYVTILLFYTGPGGVWGEDVVLRVREATMSSDPVYTDVVGNSLLTASQVIIKAREGAPLLSTDNTLIETGGFIIPELCPSSWQSPRAYMEAANAFHNKLLGVDAQSRVFFRTRPTVPEVQTGAWSGAEFSDASANSGQDVYNRVIVEAEGSDGRPIERLRTASSPLLERQGFNRTASFGASAALTEAAADLVGDLWLAEKRLQPLRGSLKITGGGLRWMSGDGDVHPSQALLLTGRRVLMGDLIDPDTGGVGRDGVIASVSYEHESQTASIELGTDTKRLETLLSRYAVLTDGV